MAVVTFSPLRGSMHAAAADILSEHDAWLERHFAPLTSMAPGRAMATPLAGLGRQLLGGHAPEAQSRCARVCVAVSAARGTCFPENVYWDMDALFAAIVREHEEHGEQAMSDFGATLVEVHELFGRGGRINFRYVHDFVYGFDWAKWVRRDPEHRAHIAPLSPGFVRYVLARGFELLELIAADDDTYLRLPSDQPRNPFGFSREPAHERLLHDTLAARDLVPLRAWELEDRGRWEPEFAALRRACSEELGLPSYTER
ncbi:MAG: hypothetical protein AAGI01_05545 [Myxococcota bacterium]